jgi:hypothetical protein
MQQKHVWGFLLVIQSLTVLHAKGQETKTDSVDVGNSIKWKSSTEHLLVQPHLLQVQPVLWFPENGFSHILLPQKIFVPDMDKELKYLGYRASDSLASVLPKYPGLGDYRNFGGQLGKLNLTNNLSVDYGAFISTQYGYLFSSKQTVIGGNWLFRYTLTDWLQLQTWGQYVTQGKSSDPTFQMPNFYPKTHVGFGLQYHSGGNAKIRLGTEYKYDQNKKVWKPESGGKVLFNFK